MKNKLSLFIAIAVLLSMFAIKSKMLFDARKDGNAIIAYDVFGYYLYLPATFIYNDIGLNQGTWLDSVQQKYKPTPQLYQVTTTETEKRVIIYPMGVALCYLPGFILASGCAALANYPVDGFSAPYQYSLVFSAMLFATIGLFMFRKIMLRFFDDKIAALCILFITVGTNYFFQAGLEGIMPHNFLFTINCGILLLTIKWHQTPKIKYAFMLGLLLGWATICRPTEILWALVPLLWNVYDKETLKQKNNFNQNKGKAYRCFNNGCICGGHLATYLLEILYRPLVCI